MTRRWAMGYGAPSGATFGFMELRKSFDCNHLRRRLPTPRRGTLQFHRAKHEVARFRITPQPKTGCGVYCFLVRDGAAGCCTGFLHRNCTGFCTASPGRFGAESDVLVGDLEVVRVGDMGRVADPSAHHVNEVLLGQLGLPARPQVLESLGYAFNPARRMRNTSSLRRCSMCSIRVPPQSKL